MKVTISQLVAADAALAELREAKLPAVTAMQVVLVINAIKTPMQAFQEAYNKLIADTGKPREDDPSRYDVTDITKYRSESQDLMAQEVDISLDKKIANLGSAELKPSTILALDWLIDVKGIV